ncbi:F-box protein SKIP19 [Panicum hallii]|uniref:F-box protein SKIP19 n=1 Tax=Panicum hallii TaxID=206008 RepID=UPI000DF4EFCE|nr:F-box protein SKIP19 [Panicum hallii]
MPVETVPAPATTKIQKLPFRLPRTMAAGGDAEPAQAAPARDWSELPLDAIASVFARLDPVEILMGAGLVCRSWLHAAAAEEPSLWRHLDMASSHNAAVKEKSRYSYADVLRAMAKKAVDRSAGQLEVFIGEAFVDDDLLKYIGGR